MTTVIAIDPSLSATGLVVWRTGQPLYINTIRSQQWESYLGWGAPQRHDQISRAVTDFVETDGPNYVQRTVAVIEDMLKPSAEMARGTSTLELARLRGVIECDLYRLNVPITRVHAATLKAFCRAGKTAKADMLSAAQHHLPVEYVIHNDNEADAFWLFAMAMQAYGHPVVPVTPRRKTFGAKPVWAPFDMAAAERATGGEQPTNAHSPTYANGLLTEL
jgi:Holliday junction resolvasome RuvABC endonuclease subunit